MKPRLAIESISKGEKQTPLEFRVKPENENKQKIFFTFYLYNQCILGFEFVRADKEERKERIKGVIVTVR